jgi:hypothetical protein
MNLRVVAGFALAVSAASALPGGIIAGEGDYIGLFGGAWSGSGMVLNDGGPMEVGCQAIGQPGMNHLTIKGRCGVFLVSVAISADVSYDPKSGRYSGTYSGGDLAARISGKREGDTVALDVTWPKPINGDTSAHLTIVNSGQGRLRIVMDDNVTSGGPVQKTSDLQLSRS